LKIEKIATKIIKIPLKTPFVTALRRVENVEFVRVEIVFDDDTTAFGEAPATKAVTGEDLDDIIDSIQSVQDMLSGVSIAEALSILHLQKIGSSAKAALDMALYLKIHTLNAVDTTPIKTDITISLNDKKTMFEDAKQALQSGYDILKVKLGSDIMHAIAVTKLLAKELPNAVLLIDANQAWNLEKALKYVNAVKELKIELIEQPVLADDLESLRCITAVSKIPILADEAAFSLEDVKKIYETKAADMINIKLMKCGGVSKAVEILEYAREKKITCMLGSMLEGPLSINAAMKLAFRYRDVIKYVDLDSPLLYAQTPAFIGDFSIQGNRIE
jgi:L-alanine-DL-glutamate epimerase-like enolase superfamily enzyme